MMSCYPMFMLIEQSLHTELKMWITKLTYSLKKQSCYLDKLYGPFELHNDHRSNMKCLKF